MDWTLIVSFATLIVSIIAAIIAFAAYRFSKKSSNKTDKQLEEMRDSLRYLTGLNPKQ